MSILKKPYEISLWEDVLLYVGTPKSGKTSPTLNISDLSSVDYQYYTERKIVVLGSDVMTSPARAINPVLSRNINGVYTLKFDMYYLYEDYTTGEIVRNPLIDLVIDERKVKLKYDGGDDFDEANGWYDFIIKKDEEKGRDYKYSFTCTSLALNELSKTGFNIELDTELENNTGTVQLLGAKVLKDSEWTVANEDETVILQTNDEALYKAQITDVSHFTNIGITNGSGTIPTLVNGSIIYIYSSSYLNQESDYFLFIYTEKSTPDLMDDGVTINCTNVSGGTYDLHCKIPALYWKSDGTLNGLASSIGVADYRGHRYVRKQQTAYDSVLKKTVGVYHKDGAGSKVYYGYTTTEYITSGSVYNYIYNSVNFENTQYWSIYGEESSLDQVIYPKVTAKVTADDWNGTSYLLATFKKSGARLMNNGILLNFSRIESFDLGDEYTLRIKVGQLSNDTMSYKTSLPFRCVVKKYIKVDLDNDDDIIYFDSSDSSTTTKVEDGYIKVTLTCLKAASLESLRANVGIYFIRNGNTNANPYYILDVQFFPLIEDSSGNEIYPDTVPEASIIEHYYFYSKEDNIGKTSEEDYVYSSSNKDLYTPVYGSGDAEFEKVRSIKAKESNRFNLLQELSETFECWVRFVVHHEANGTIKIKDSVEYDLIDLTSSTYLKNKYYIYNLTSEEYELSTGNFDKSKLYYKQVSRLRLDKSVIFYKENLTDNFAGFKYGINLKDNNRTLDSELIVTKIIVKNNNNEFGTNGFCSIARAKDNPTKENFAINLDYYVSLGILSRSEVNRDLNLTINGSIGLYPRLATLNKERNELISSAAATATEIDRLTSETNAAQLAYNNATEELSRLKDPVSGLLKLLTGYVYEDFFNQYGRKGYTGVKNFKIPSYANTVYYIKKGGMTGINGNKDVTFYKKETEKPPVGNRKYYTLKNSTFLYFDQTKSKFSDTTDYFYINPTTISNGKYVDNIYFLNGNSADNDKLFRVTFNGGDSNTEIYMYAPASRADDMEDGHDLTTDSSVVALLARIRNLETIQKLQNAIYEEKSAALEKAKEDYEVAQKRLTEIANATAEVEKDFNKKYGRYIQEGSWIDDNYMDDDLYYLDALDVLYLSAYPKVTYSFNPIDLSLLEGYEVYGFLVGHKTYVEDVEMFGYKIVNGLRTPLRETVVVTELTLNLDEPDKNQIKILNYKSHFEDLFQRITAATQSLLYHSGEYARAAGAIEPDGVISTTTMARTMASAAFIIKNSQNQSVELGVNGLTATKLDDPAQIACLTSAGLIISNDGGLTWGVAISGSGINTNYLSAGTIDADRINIMSGTYPAFRWDSHGLRAYAFETGVNGEIYSYDPSRFVNFDRFGIYGINGLSNPNFNTVNEVEQRAMFALTWNGLFIRNTYRNGYVSISPNDDITLYSYGTSKFLQVEAVADTYTDSDGNTFEFVEVNGKDFKELYDITPGNYYYKDNRNVYVQCTNEDYNYVANLALNGQLYTQATSSESTNGSIAIKRGKFGLLETDSEGNEIYGLALYDQNGAPTLETKSTGTLWLKSLMDIGTLTGNLIYIGVGKQATADEIALVGDSHGYKVISVHGEYDDSTSVPSGRGTNIDRFIVFEDGFIMGHGEMQLDGVSFPSGTIGGMSIAKLPETIGVRIVAKKGDTFRIDEFGDPNPESLLFNFTTGLDDSDIQSVIWEYADNANFTNSVSTTIQKVGNEYPDYELNYTDVSSLFSDGLIYIRCTLNKFLTNSMNSMMSIKLSLDGRAADAYSFNIESSLGYTINSSDLSTLTTITGHVYKNNLEVTNDIVGIKWYIKFDSGDFTEIDFDNLTPTSPIELVEGHTTPPITTFILKYNDWNLNPWSGVLMYFEVLMNAG